MNNEPVAWMNRLGRLEYEQGNGFEIPLYTHSAKPIDKPDECISGCPENQTCDYCAGIKTLTDEEILKVIDKFWNRGIGGHDKDWLFRMTSFARAILRKASER